MRIVLIAGALALSQVAFAAEAPVKQDTMPKPAGMTIAECTTVLAGLEALDGYQTVINEGKPNVQVVARSYVFGNGTLRADIAHDISALRDVRHTAQEAQQAIFRELAKGATEILQTVADQAGKEHPNQVYAEYVRELNEATDKPCLAILTRINLKDLKLEVNEIPGSALSNIDKILDR